MERKLLGRWGEALAAEEYRRHGYKVVDTNVHSRFGEIDLILEKGGKMIFCEVKLRKDDHFAEAREFVNAAKQQKVVKTALFWTANTLGKECEMRFDVAEIYAPLGTATAKPIVHILENAFGTE